MFIETRLHLREHNYKRVMKLCYTKYIECLTKILFCLTELWLWLSKKQTSSCQTAQILQDKKKTPSLQHNKFTWLTQTKSRREREGEPGGTIATIPTKTGRQKNTFGKNYRGRGHYLNLYFQTDIAESRLNSPIRWKTCFHTFFF